MMALQPINWNVIIVGRWNRAILTPAGIAKRLFELDAGTQVGVVVPLDGVSPYMVRHPLYHITVMTDEGRLLIPLLRPDYETLGHAMTAGVSALTSLPETPVTAAGLNIGFHAAEMTPEMGRLFVSEFDTHLADAGLESASRSATRSLKHGNGLLNVIATGSQDSFDLLLNFHRSSEAPGELKTWLQEPVDALEKEVKKVLDALDMEIEEVKDDASSE